MSGWITTCGCYIDIKENYLTGSIIYEMKRPCTKHYTYTEKDPFKLASIVADESRIPKEKQNG